MKTYIIRRPKFWSSIEALEQTASVSARVGNEEMSNEVRWIRSYVVEEPDGSLGTVCVYQAISPDAIREHAARVGMPADEIREVKTTVIIRADPQESGVPEDERAA